MLNYMGELIGMTSLIRAAQEMTNEKKQAA